jgi:antitoxin MazE
MKTLEQAEFSIYNVETMGDKEIRIRASVGKWGNSAAVRLPATIMTQANFSAQQPINILLSKGRIILEPVNSPEFDLDEMLTQIQPEHLHGEINFGGPAGKEVF